MLSEMAKLVRRALATSLTPSRCSFGVPPHRYQIMRRIRRKRTLPAVSRTFLLRKIEMRLGFAQTSAFTSVFRQIIHPE